ncbi:MAG: PcfJ domain-containing protein [Mediterraneibacter gnavus]
MAEELGYNMRESWILFPKNLEQRHEELIEESREREIKAKEDLDNKKIKNTRNIENGTAIWKWKRNNLC